MKVDQLPGNVNLTYCTNIHAGESWPDIRASLDAHVPAIKAAVAPGRPLGIGLRLSGEAAAVAQQPEQLEAFREQPSQFHQHTRETGVGVHMISRPATFQP
jgi:hypothetical protein